MALAKTRDRRVIRTPIRRDHTVGDILHALALNHPRGALPLAVGVEQQREHHPRLVRRTAVAIPAVGAIERRQIHLLDRRQHEPRKMILRQPPPQTRRQQQLQITVTSNEVLGHTRIVLNPPDSTLYATATTNLDSADSRAKDACFRRAKRKPAGRTPTRLVLVQRGHVELGPAPARLRVKGVVSAEPPPALASDEEPPFSAAQCASRPPSWTS